MIVMCPCILADVIVACVRTIMSNTYLNENTRWTSELLRHEFVHWTCHHPHIHVFKAPSQTWPSLSVQRQRNEPSDERLASATASVYGSVTPTLRHSCASALVAIATNQLQMHFATIDPVLGLSIPLKPNYIRWGINTQYTNWWSLYYVYNVWNSMLTRTDGSSDNDAVYNMMLCSFVPVRSNIK